MEKSNTSNRSALSRGCDQCIKIKRKCSRTLPQCERCVKRNSHCSYKNQPLADELPLAMDAGGSKKVQQSGTSMILAHTGPSFDAGSNTYYIAHDFRSHAVKLETPRLLGHLKFILPVDKKTVVYLLEYLRSTIGLFARSSGTSFIHPNMYKEGLPPLLQTMFSLCRLHTSKPDPRVFHQAIAKVAQELVLSIPSTCSFKAKLALAQSFILLEIMTLFFPITASLRRQAQQRIPLLHKSVEDVYCSAPVTLPPTMGRYQAWLLAESCRRTIHVTHILSRTHIMSTCDTFTLGLSATALPIDRNGELWDWDVSKLEGGEGNTQLDEYLKRSELISYRELMDMWDTGKYKYPTSFDALLITACSGVDNSRRLRMGGTALVIEIKS